MSVRVFNYQPVLKGVLLGTVSVDLGGGVITHQWRILKLEGGLTAELPQVRRGAETHNLLEIEPKEKLEEIKRACLAFYREQTKT